MDFIIAVASAGIENVVASCGTSLTAGQVRLLGRSSRRVVMNYDPDSAGVAATERSLDLLLEEGFEIGHVHISCPKPCDRRFVGMHQASLLE